MGRRFGDPLGNLIPTLRSPVPGTSSPLAAPQDCSVLATHYSRSSEWRFVPEPRPRCQGSCNTSRYARRIAAMDGSIDCSSSNDRLNTFTATVVVAPPEIRRFEVSKASWAEKPVDPAATRSGIRSWSMSRRGPCIRLLNRTSNEPSYVGAHSHPSLHTHRAQYRGTP